MGEGGNQAAPLIHRREGDVAGKVCSVVGEFEHVDTETLLHVLAHRYDDLEAIARERGKWGGDEIEELLRDVLESEDPCAKEARYEDEDEK